MTPNEFSNRFNQQESFLYNFALKLSKNAEDAKDLFQETTIRAFKYRDRFQIGTNFAGWMATIMRNTFINHYRKMKKRRTVSEPVESFAFALESKVVTPNAGESSLRLQELKIMLDEIGDLYSVPFILHYKGYEYKEIADQLDVPIGTIKSRIFTARDKMKKLIASRYA